MHRATHPELSERQAQSLEPKAQSLPGSETRDLLIQLREQRKGSTDELTIAKLAKAVGCSSSVMSQYLDEDGNKYPGDVISLERKVDDFIRNEVRRKFSGVETLETPQVKELHKALEYIRKTNDVGCVLTDAGVTKTRGVDFYVLNNPLAILHRTRQWCKDEQAIMRTLFEATKGGYDNRTPRMGHCIRKLTGSNRLLVFDDAHKLTRSALQLILDVHDETLCPVALVGIYELEDKLAEDPQRFSRIGLRWEIKPENPTLLIEHLIRSLCASVTTADIRDLTPLCEQVAEQHGHFRSVHKQLKVAAELRENNAGLAWDKAFKSAHTILVRKYPLN